MRLPALSFVSVSAGEGWAAPFGSSNKLSHCVSVLPNDNDFLFLCSACVCIICIGGVGEWSVHACACVYGGQRATSDVFLFCALPYFPSVLVTFLLLRRHTLDVDSSLHAVNTIGQ